LGNHSEEAEANTREEVDKRNVVASAKCGKKIAVNAAVLA
jgi:hypothetical protein